MRLVVGFGWIDIVVEFINGVRLVVGQWFVVGHVMTKPVGMD